MLRRHWLTMIVTDSSPKSSASSSLIDHDSDWYESKEQGLLGSGHFQMQLKLYMLEAYKL